MDFDRPGAIVVYPRQKWRKGNCEERQVEAKHEVFRDRRENNFRYE